jgi:hypothetical protein
MSLLGWIGRALLRWPVAVVVGLAYVLLVRALGYTGPSGTRPVDDHLALTLLYAWVGMPLHLALLAWRSGRPGFRVWAVTTSPVVLLIVLPFVLALWLGPTPQGALLTALAFGAIVPERPVARTGQAPLGSRTV